VLSPLRFHYDSEQFNLPIRLGLMNSGGTQDLLVHILAPGQRYEVANYNNVTIPTNIEVADEVRTQFGAFYNALFDAAQTRHPGAVVTEYAWDAGTCDPCPTPPLDENEVATLGADVIPGAFERGMVLTRLHARYGKELVGQDLVFRAAPAIVGGREMNGQDGAIERGAQSSPHNNFQGRYIIRHAWTGPVSCDNPRRGVWGGPPGGGRDPQVKPAMNIAFEPRGQVELGSLLRTEVKDDDFRTSAADPGSEFRTSGIPPRGGCAGCSSGPGGLAGLVLLAAAMFLALRRRRRGL
jgi:MYXO-CTERM domain-containing protein